MNETKKRTLALIILILIVILFAIGFFIWANFLNKGTLIIKVNAPFIVIEDERKQICETSPCTLKIRSGQRLLIITKQGYEDFETQIKIPLFDSIEIIPDLKLIPILKSSDNFDIPEYPSYEISINKENQMQQLSQDGTLITFFPNSLKDPIIYPGQNHLIVTDKHNAYKVNLDSKEKTKIPKLYSAAFTWAQISPSGNYMAYTDHDSIQIKDFNTNQVRKLTILSPSTLLTWTTEDTLLFATLDYPNSENTLILGLYSPETEDYRILLETSQFTTLPENLYITPNLSEIFFIHDQKTFKIILRKF